MYTKKKKKKRATRLRQRIITRLYTVCKNTRRAAIHVCFSASNPSRTTLGYICEKRQKRVKYRVTRTRTLVWSLKSCAYFVIVLVRIIWFAPSVRVYGAQDYVRDVPAVTLVYYVRVHTHNRG